MLLLVSCAALTLVTAIFVLRPLFRGADNGLDILLMAETEADRLVDRKAAIYVNLKDLALEHAMGRLSDDDFHRLEAGYKADAAVILQKLEAIDASEDLEARIEKEIASRKKEQPVVKPAPEAVNTLCPYCGAETIAGKNFCADCGHEL